MQFRGLAAIVFFALLGANGFALAEVLPLTVGLDLPGVLPPHLIDAPAGGVGLDNSVAGLTPVAVSQQTTAYDVTTTTTATTVYTYRHVFAAAQSATQLRNYINGLTPAQLATNFAGSAAQPPQTRTAVGPPTTTPKLVLTNIGGGALAFSQYLYFHARSYNTSLIGGLPGAGGTGVTLTTLAAGEPAVEGAFSSSTINQPLQTSAGPFSTPTSQSVPGGVAYSWTQSVTTARTSIVTRRQTLTDMIQNLPATAPAFSDLRFALVSDPGVWTSAPPINEAQGAFGASDFTVTNYSTGTVAVIPQTPNVQYMMLENFGPSDAPTLYPIHHANEYALLISGILAPYSTGRIDYSVSSVPEPPTLALLAMGFLALALAGGRSARRRRREIISDQSTAPAQRREGP